MDNYFNFISSQSRNSLHHQYCRLSNYGHKSIKIQGPKLWNDLPGGFHDLPSLALFKRRLKSLFLDQYCCEKLVSNHYYVSDLSICNLKLTISKMRYYFVPQFLPSRPLRVCHISDENGHIKITLKVCSK